MIGALQAVRSSVQDTQKAQDAMVSSVSELVAKLAEGEARVVDLDKKLDLLRKTEIEIAEASNALAAVRAAHASAKDSYDTFKAGLK